MADLVNVPEGQCRFEFVSATQVKLSPHRGTYLPLKIGGAWQAKLIPTAGVTGANTGLTAATLYYWYAYDNAGDLELEASATAYAVDPDSGVAVRSDDPSRTLVGMTLTGAGTPGVFQAQGVGTLSWYGKKVLPLPATTFTANRTSGATTYAEVNSEIRRSFVTWADEFVAVYANGRWQNGSSNGSRCSLAFDGAVPDDLVSGSGISGQGDWPIGLFLHKIGLGEGGHYVTLVAFTGGGTMNFYGNATNADHCTLRASVVG